jgi:hypothetical protein
MNAQNLDRAQLLEVIKDKKVPTPKPAHQIKTADLAKILEAYLKVEKVDVAPKEPKAPKDKVEPKVEEPKEVVLTEAGDKNNCTVKMLQNAFGIEKYEDAAQEAINLWGRKRGHGVKGHLIVESFATGKKVLGKKLEKVEATNAYLAIGGGTITRKMNLTSFSRKFKKGTFVILVSRHALVCKDGELLNAVMGEYGPKNALVENAWEVK